MSKVSNLPTFTSAPNSSQMNDAFTKITEAFDNTVSRDGSSPNTMSADLDLNGNDILNVGTLESENVNVNGTLTVNGSPIGASILVFNSTEDGLVPASGGGTDNFLRADGTWAEPAGGGGGGSSAWSDLTDVPAPVTALSGVNTGDETAAGILAKLVTVDGAGSGLDADLLDGQSSAAFATAVHTHTAADVSAPGSTTQIVYNNAGALAGSSNVEIENNQLRLEAIASPVAPASGGVSLVGITLTGVGGTGRVHPTFLTSEGTPRELGLYPVRNPQYWCFANSGAANFANLGHAGFVNVGTLTSAAIGVSSRYNYFPRTEWLATAAATNAVAGFRCSGSGFVTVGGAGSGYGGFDFVGVWGPATGVATTTMRACFGLGTVGTPADSEPSSDQNCVIMGWDAADTEVQIMHNDGAGTCTKVPLGASFPVPTLDRSALYQLALYSPKGTTQSVEWTVTDLISGGVQSGQITTNLPSTTSLCAPRGFVGAGGTSSVAGFALTGFVLEPLM